MSGTKVDGSRDTEQGSANFEPCPPYKASDPPAYMKGG